MISALSTFQSNSLYAAFKVEPTAENEDRGYKNPTESPENRNLSFFDQKLAARVNDVIFSASELFSNQNPGEQRYGFGAGESSREISVSKGGREIASSSEFSSYAYEYELNSDSISVSFSTFSSSELALGEKGFGAKSSGLEFELEIRSDGSISFSMSNYMTKEAERSGFGFYSSEVETFFNMEIFADGSMIQEYESYSERSFFSDGGDLGFAQLEEFESFSFLSEVSKEGLPVNQLQEGFDPEFQSVMNTLDGVLQSIDEAQSRMHESQGDNRSSIFGISSSVSTSSVILAYQEY
ncbi:MAG: hypothetical protein AAF412_00595 [Pseudomonadota bacterium]